ncbi:hypothetical protein LIER_01895 [Lithospermum erythrorhizon]|uniref:RNase H type-1 domain-containing protein n=1 Tax=Lithospermum erythrorhizon TaxID=34254 RepID=A0AAV3NMI6_LITER
MCTDFTHLNKACPMDFYLLPCLARLVDGSGGHEVMSFDLKNAGETYQRMVNFIFANQRNMEIYVDDMLVKNRAVSSVLVQDVEGEKSPIYYVSEFDISFFPRTSIKSQAFADFIIECTTQCPQVISGLGDFEPGLSNPKWVLFVDEARNKKGSGVGVLLRGPDGVVMEYDLRFTFPTTNSEVEYESMVTGLTIVKSLRNDRIWVIGDSKLIMDQMKGVCGKSLGLENPYIPIFGQWSTP